MSNSKIVIFGFDVLSPYHWVLYFHLTTYIFFRAWNRRLIHISVSHIESVYRQIIWIVCVFYGHKLFIHAFSRPSVSAMAYGWNCQVHTVFWLLPWIEPCSMFLAAHLCSLIHLRAGFLLPFNQNKNFHFQAYSKCIKPNAHKKCFSSST